jgi:hypothetical protein
VKTLLKARGLLIQAKWPLCAAALLLSLFATGQAPAAKASGPLRVHPTNPRYFTDGSGKAIYLTGSHTWTNLQDVSGYKELVTNLDELGGFQKHLEWLRSYNHNFIRLWILEHAWDAAEGATVSPLPWPRTGPGNGLDGKPRFDVTKFDPVYFDRLRARVLAAGNMGFYVSVMLFDSWSIEHQGTWKGHPFHASNNINGINGDPDNDGLGIETHTLKIPAVTKLQEAYARKVVETVNDLDNVLYGISNESEYGVDWHNHLARVIQDYEKGKPKRHRVGITGGGPQTPSSSTVARTGFLRLSGPIRQQATGARSSLLIQTTSDTSAGRGCGGASSGGTIPFSWTGCTNRPRGTAPRIRRRCARQWARPEKWRIG